MQPDPQLATSDLAWPDRIYAIFKRNRISQVGYVPDTGHARLIALCQQDPEIADVVLTSEAEGAGLVAGAALGGARAALLMQSAGVGNCVNMFSLLQSCGFPCLVVVTMRGEFADFNPWQVPMGSIAEPTLKACGFLTYRIEQADDVEEVVAAGCEMAFGGSLRVAILLSQRLVERKPGSRVMLNRRDFVAALLRDRGDLLVVTGLGTPTFDVAACGDHPLNFYLWGAMGSAAMVGLGLALARRDRRVAVITGDGEALMGIGSLATIGVRQPDNLAIVVLDNGHYGATGMQPSHTKAGIDLVAMARACRFRHAQVVSETDAAAGVRASLHAGPGPILIQALVKADSLPRIMPSRDGHEIKQRFIQALAKQA